MQKGVFNGFSPETLTFLRNLRENNNKEWFEANRYNYDMHVLNPLKLLVSDIGYFMLTIDPLFEITPAVDKTIARIYRDVRFSKDKSPYRSNIWITFRRASRDWKEDPVFFFEIFPDWYRYGMGFYSASKDTMDNFRKRVEERPGEFSDVISFYNEEDGFIIDGEKYKRPLSINVPPNLTEWCQRKNIYIIRNRVIDETFYSSRLVEDLISDFKKIEPFYNYLWKVKI